MVIMVAVIALQIGLVNNAAAKGVVACSPAGVWDYGNGNMAMIVPLDPTGKMFAVTVDIAKPTSFNESRVQKLQGIVERIGRNLYAYTLFRYEVEFYRGPITKHVVLVGETEMIDCDTRVTTSYYQERDADGTPQFDWIRGRDGIVYRMKLETKD